MYDFELLEKHQHKTNKLVRSTLRAVSRQLGIGYSDTLDFFRNGGEQVTIVFWELLYKNPMNKFRYNRVDYCHGCKKFNLYFDSSED